VAPYVVVARVYPPVLHPKIFAAFSAAWAGADVPGQGRSGEHAQR
jgi:hypothetical protein